MARAYGLKAKLQFTYILDIDHSVGKTAPNRRDDVMLVQYLLSVWMAHEKDPKFGKMLAGVPVLKIDGIYGPKTQAVIDFFEAFHQPTVNRDGRIDPASQTINTRKQFLLNQILFFAGGLRGGVPETRIPFPAALLPALYR